MSTQKSIQLLQIKAASMRDCFDSNVTTLIYKKKSAAARLISYPGFVQKQIFLTPR